VGGNLRNLSNKILVIKSGQVFFMKKLLLLFFGVLLICSCKKNNSPAPQQEVVSGTLRYSNPAFDGAGLYYTTDSAETLIFKDYTVSMSPDMDPKYSDFINVHSRLMYTWGGEKGCTVGMNTAPCTNNLRKVVVIKLEKL
jgi:hypothetical protein